MKFSESWLKELINVPVDTDGLADQLTMAGLEVEAISNCMDLFSDVIVGKVIKIQSHTEADNLNICRVEIGSNECKTVICGATNVTVGESYPYARLGARLPGGIIIEKRTIKGISSEGMLCSATELGLAENVTGIFQLGEGATTGQALQDYLLLNDNTIELSLTPNRGDCLSLMGLAREVAVLNQKKFIPPNIEPVTNSISTSRKIIILATEACPRYCGRIIENINSTVKTPIWITERLRRSDIRSINVVVDLTNYVMLELGQPMHAFDEHKLTGDISIRFAEIEEKLAMLDGETRNLTTNTLVIADNSGAIAMAGIMGGAESSVTRETKSVFLESAFFNPQAIMGRARYYGLHTEASHRFERGVDPELPLRALDRLTTLLIDTCGGHAGPVNHQYEAKHLPQSTTLILRSHRIKKILGVEIAGPRVVEILEQLGFKIIPKEQAWEVTVPTFRCDVSIEADLIEEIARIYGYNQIPGSLPQLQMKMGNVGWDQQCQQLISQTLMSLGYREVITYSFIDPELQKLFSPDNSGIELMNPISADMSTMRQNLWPGLITSLLHNIKRQQTRMRLFEIGHVFSEIERITEKSLLSGLIYGNIYEKQWGTSEKLSDFYDLKSDVEAILHPFLDKNALRFSKTEGIIFHAYQSAKIIYNNQEIGLMGSLSPRILSKLGIQKPVFMFELDLSSIPSKNTVNYVKYSKFPSVRRDISIIIDEKIPVTEVMNHIKTIDRQVLHNLELFDVYQGEGIDSGKKSLALGLTFQRSSSTLTDEEADIVVNSILQSLYEQFRAILRE